jgi:hypothetical protein
VFARLKLKAVCNAPNALLTLKVFICSAVFLPSLKSQHSAYTDRNSRDCRLSSHHGEPVSISNSSGQQNCELPPCSKRPGFSSNPKQQHRGVRQFERFLDGVVTTSDGLALILVSDAVGDIAATSYWLDRYGNGQPVRRLDID